MDPKAARPAGNERFRDAGTRLEAFTDEALVECPRCGACAVSRSIEPHARPDLFAPRRLACNRCPYVKDWAERAFAHRFRRLHDDHFDLPLWLRTPCCGDVLWAYNARHLAFLEEFVGARLREDVRGEYGWSNKSLASRLPAWIKSRKNREEVLKGLARLRARLLEA